MFLIISVGLMIGQSALNIHSKVNGVARRANGEMGATPQIPTAERSRTGRLLTTDRIGRVGDQPHATIAAASGDAGSGSSVYPWQLIASFIRIQLTHGKLPSAMPSPR
ncbi:hypothetical protein [Burkholderia sp. AW49-1]